MRFHVNLQVVARGEKFKFIISHSIVVFLPSAESGLAMLAFVLLVPGVEFRMSVPGPFVFEKPRAVGTGELKLFRVGLEFTKVGSTRSPVISMAVT